MEALRLNQSIPHDTETPGFLDVRDAQLHSGQLVDVSRDGREAGIPFPLAVSSDVWGDCIEWDRADNRRQRTCQDQKGRQWDVVYMASLAWKRSPVVPFDRAYSVYCVPRDGQSQQPKLVNLVLVVTRCELGFPYGTIMTARRS